MEDPWDLVQAASRMHPEFKYPCDSDADCGEGTLCLDSLYTDAGSNGQFFNGRGCYEWEADKCPSDELFAAENTADDNGEYEQYKCRSGAMTLMSTAVALLAAFLF